MNDIVRELERFLRDHRARGHIDEWRISQDINDYSLRLEIRLHDRRLLGYRLTETELNQGGLRALRYWMDTIDHEIMDYVRHNPPRRPNRYTREDMWREMATLMQYATTLQDSSYFRRQYLGNFGIAPVDEKAEKRARDLFKFTAGQAAYDTLNSNKPFAITGSKGTKYTLHNRSTYCVERVKDGAKLCAVVPNVPLWDHLLGIKIIVENDEPAFLKTANISGDHIWNSIRNDPIRWQRGMIAHRAARG